MTNTIIGLDLCECGCGKTPSWGRFCRGHNLNAHRSAEERFWRQVVKSDGCWQWAGSDATAGYGRLRLSGGKRILAHRFSWELHYGPVPEGLLACHKCDNRLY